MRWEQRQKSTLGQGEIGLTIRNLAAISERAVICPSQLKKQWMSDIIRLARRLVVNRLGRNWLPSYFRVGSGRANEV
jgi:hypothetical protein